MFILYSFGIMVCLKWDSYIPAGSLGDTVNYFVVTQNCFLWYIVNQFTAWRCEPWDWKMSRVECTVGECYYVDGVVLGGTVFYCSYCRGSNTIRCTVNQPIQRIFNVIASFALPLKWLSKEAPCMHCYAPPCSILGLSQVKSIHQ